MMNYFVFLLFCIVNSVLCCDFIDTEILQQNQHVELAFKLDNVADEEGLYEIEKPGDSVLYIGLPGQFKLSSGSTNQKNRTNVTVNNITLFTFQLENVTSQDAGVYCCTSGRIKVPGCGVKLIVTDKPNIRLSPGQPVLRQMNGALLGEITMTCNVTSTTKPADHNLPMIYRWFKDGIYYGNGRILQDRVVNRTDIGDDIICIATDDPDCKTSLQDTKPETVVKGERCEDVLGISNKFILRPEYGPYDTTLTYGSTTLKTGYEIQKRIGEALSVNCMSDCNPACNISWYKDEKMLSYISQLNLPHLQESDDGVYTCTVYNIHGTRDMSFILDLPYAPEETGGRGVIDITVAVGQNVSTTKTITAYSQPYISQNSLITPLGTERQHIHFVLLNTTKPHHYYLILTVFIINVDYLGEYCVNVHNEGGNLRLCNNFKDPDCCPPAEIPMSSDDVNLVDLGEMIILLREVTGRPQPSLEVESMILPVGVNNHPRYINYSLINTIKPHHYNLSLSVHVVTKHYLATNDVVNASTGITIIMFVIVPVLLLAVFIIGLILVKKCYNSMAPDTRTIPLEHHYDQVAMRQLSTGVTTLNRPTNRTLLRDRESFITSLTQVSSDYARPDSLIVHRQPDYDQQDKLTDEVDDDGDNADAADGDLNDTNSASLCIGSPTAVPNVYEKLNKNTRNAKLNVYKKLKW